MADGALTTSFALKNHAFLVPTGHKAMYLALYNFQPAANSTIYFDEVQVTHYPQYGPTIVGNVRGSTAYNDFGPRWAIGNLNGLYGYHTSSTYGAAFGDPADVNLTIDSTNGIRIREGLSNTTRAQWAADGSLLIGSTGTGNGNFYVDSSGNAYIRSGTTNKISLDTSGNISLVGDLAIGTAGALRSGATAYGTGTGI